MNRRHLNGGRLCTIVGGRIESHCNDRAKRGLRRISHASGVICGLDYDSVVSLRWDFSTLADRFGGILSQAEADLRLEQAVYGLDAKDELTLHALLAEGLRRW